MVLFLRSKKSFCYIPENEIEQDILGWNTSQVISVSCYPEALVEAFLCLQVFSFVISGGKTCLYSKGILRMGAVKFCAPNRITRGELFSEPKEILTEDPYSTPLWGLALHVRALSSNEIPHAATVGRWPKQQQRRQQQQQ